MKNIIFALLCCFCLLLSACSNSGDSDPGSGQSSLTLSEQDFSAVADGSGLARFSFSLPAASTAFQMAASRGSLSALSSGSENLLNRTDQLSSQQRGQTINVPYYASALSASTAINAAFLTDPGAVVSLKVFSKKDAAGNTGTLKLNIVLLGPVDNSEDTMNAIDVALEGLRITYGRANISLDTLITSFDGPGTAPAPGDPLYQSLVSSQRQQAINVVIAANRRGTGSNEYRYGTTGSLPFPVVANADSVIVISLDDITGNGVFDDSVHNDEIRLLGEEIGRFTAKALGLPNAVNLKGDRVTSSDDIPDSPGCISKTSCREDPSARTNLMMPEPLLETDESRDGSGRAYYPRDQLTDQQAQVLNNSVLVD